MRLRAGRNGVTANREPVLELPVEGWVEWEAQAPRWVETADIVCDSELSTQIITMDYSEEYPAGHQGLPGTLLSAVRVSGRRTDGQWEVIHEVRDNWRRLIRIPVQRRLTGLRLAQFATVGGHATVRLVRVSWTGARNGKPGRLCDVVKGVEAGRTV